MIPGTGHRSPGIYIQLRKTLKTSARIPSDESCVTSHRFKWVPFLLDEVGSIAEHVRREEGGEKRKGRVEGGQVERGQEKSSNKFRGNE